MIFLPIRVTPIGFVIQLVIDIIVSLIMSILIRSLVQIAEDQFGESPVRAVMGALTKFTPLGVDVAVSIESLVNAYSKFLKSGQGKEWSLPSTWRKHLGDTLVGKQLILTGFSLALSALSLATDDCVAKLVIDTLALITAGLGLHYLVKHGQTIWSKSMNIKTRTERVIEFGAIALAALLLTADAAQCSLE